MVVGSHLAAAPALTLGACTLQTGALAPDAGGAADSAADARGMDAFVPDSSMHDAQRDASFDGPVDSGPADTAVDTTPTDAPADTSTADTSPSGPITIRVECEDGTLRGGMRTGVDWIRMYSQDGSSDAMHMGFDATDIRRVYAPRTGEGAWIHQTHDGDDDLRFDGLSPGPKTLVVGVGEPRARCDRVVLTTDSAFVATEAP